MLQNLVLLMAFQLAGNFIVKVLGIPFPGPLCGMGLLLLYLHVTGGPSAQLRATGDTLVDHLGLLFVPAGAAIVSYGALVANEGARIAIALVVSTVASILVGGAIAQAMARRAAQTKAVAP